MAAPIENKNAIGNKGGKPYSKENREKAATLKGLALDWMMEKMQGDDEAIKKEIVMRIATTCIPQVVEGDSEAPLFIRVIKEIADKNGISDVSTINNSTGLPPIQSS
jgi:hypothetical protein